MVQPRYARGKAAWGVCAKSGRRMLLRDMVTDPYSGLLVDPAWAEPKLPPAQLDLNDAIALRRPIADLDKANIGSAFVFGEDWNWATGDPFPPLDSSTEVLGTLAVT